MDLYFVASGDATSQMGFRRGSLPSVVATVFARSTPTVSAVASFSTQCVSRRPSGSRSEEGQMGVLVKPRVLAKVPTTRRHATTQWDSQLQLRNNAFQCLQSKLSRQPDPESPNSSKCCSPRWAKRTTCTMERKQKRVEQAKEATERAREALNSAMASQREEENLLAEGERRLAELMKEEKATPSPFQVNPVCNVNVELDHLRAEIARLRQQQDGIRPVVASVEANHIPVKCQELEFWMNHRAGDLRDAIEENNAARRLQLITLLAECQRRLHSWEEEDALLEGEAHTRVNTTHNTTTQPHNHTTTQPHNHTTTLPHYHTTTGLVITLAHKSDLLRPIWSEAVLTHSGLA